MKKQPYELYDTWDNPFAVELHKELDKTLLWKRVAILLSIVNVGLLGVMIL
jgi:hypothetical protein